MASTSFVSKQTVVPAAWLNDVNTVVYTYFGNGTSLNSPTKLAVTQGVFSTSVGSPILDSVVGSLLLKGAGTTALTITGADVVTSGNFTLNNGSTLTLTGGTIAGTPTWSSNQAITLSTAAQPNVTSVGTLTSLTTSGAITLTSATSQIVPGTTSLSLRNHANSADNILINDNGNTTVRGTFTATGGIPGTLTSGTNAVMNPFVASSKTTQAHGLGVTPTFIQTYIECLTAEQGYSIGDRIFQQFASNVNFGFIVEFDATNIVIITQGALDAINKTTPAGPVGLTAANWKVVAIPYKVN